MQSKKMFFWMSCIVVIASTLFISSCSKKFDEPPLFQEPNITANKTIAALKAMHVTGQVEAITDDFVIAGIVNADDKSGNYYKQISIQDSTGGITIRLDGTNLYSTYPVGRKVYIKLKGLFMGDYNSLIQIGGSSGLSGGFLNVNPLASNLFDTYILKGSTGNAVAPKVVAVSDLNNTFQSMLIQIDNAEFLTSDTSKSYADASNSLSANLNIKSCAGGGNIIIRSSGFANFAGINAPNGNGSLLAIYTTFGATKQLVIRDTSDVKFYGSRCGTGPTTLLTTANLRALFTGTTINAPANNRITGIVISDKNAQNTIDQNLVLQQGNGLAGIIVRFTGAHNFNLGDSIDVNVTGGSLGLFSGALQVSNLDLGNAAVVSTGKTITPRAATIAELNTNIAAWESTLIKVANITITGGTGGTWAGNTTFNDGATVVHFTRTGTAGATFQSAAYPTGTVTSVTGVAGKFNATNQLSIRNLNDVVGGTGGGGGTGTVLLNEDFEGTTTSNTLPLAIANWQNASEVGTQKYQSRLFSNNKYAQISAFSSNEAVVTSWLVTKSFDLNSTVNEVLTFDSKAGFNNGATLKVLISTDYIGTGNPWAAGVNWTDITTSAILSPGLATGYPTNFTASGNISLNSYAGTAFIAFKYEGADAAGTASDKTTTWQIDKIKVAGN